MLDSHRVEAHKQMQFEYLNRMEMFSEPPLLLYGQRRCHLILVLSINAAFTSGSAPTFLLAPAYLQHVAVRQDFVRASSA